ncbi:MAG: hypothetical protein M3R59_06925 [Verrucomicrobiota bacterium]|nr:hypothetical protein [Verrucomicrobiota bacterium]
MIDPSVLVARKKISAPDGTALMYMDISLKAVTPLTFTILSESLKGGAPTREETMTQMASTGDAASRLAA